MEPLKLIKVGSSGQQVKDWQYFLIGNELYHGKVDGDFGPLTLEATIKFQKSVGLQPDGIVGNKTYGAAMLLNFDAIIDNRKDRSGANWPPKPKFSPLSSNLARQKIFGKFAFKHSPVPTNHERIVITDGWQKNNIISVTIPQLKIVGRSSMYFHKMAADQLKSLWKDWEDADLLHLVLSFDGDYVSRFVRGSRSVLSNHAFGSAFDINYSWNKLKAVPALVGQKGSVRDLVPIANNNGFYWGGHFSRLDGMHFEVAKIF